jgi:hypothetical protein
LATALFPMWRLFFSSAPPLRHRVSPVNEVLLLRCPLAHAGGRRDHGGAPSREGSLIGTRYRWTTPDMEARVVSAIEQRLAVSFAVAAQVKDD